MKFTLFLFIVIGIHLRTAFACTATIQLSRSSPVPEINGYVILECVVQGCQSEYTLEWRKYTVREDGTNDQLLTVYKYDYLSNGPTETGTDYNIIGRTEYSKVFDVHALAVTELEIRDNGTWACDLVSEDYDGNNHDMILIVRAESPERPVTIQPETPNIVNDRPYSFICRVNGVNPAPWINWFINDTAAFQGTSDNKIENLYWSISNTAQITFQAIGEANVKCSMGYNDETWENKSTTVSVKARASVNDPVADSKDEVKAYDIFELTVKASGFRPDLQWQFDEGDIYNGSLYDIISIRDEGLVSSTLKSYHLATPFTCDSVTTYEGIYTCKAMLDPEYDSSIISPKMNIKILHAPIGEGPSYYQINARIGEQIFMNCSVCAYPTPLYTWSHGLNVIPVIDSFLTIHVRVETAGLYYCNASNHMGHEKIYYNIVLDDAGGCLTAGEIVGIVLGVMLVVIIPVGIIAFILYNRKRKGDPGQKIPRFYENRDTQSHEAEHRNESSLYELQEDVHTQELSRPTGEYSELNRTGLYINARTNVYDVLQQTS